MTDIPALADAPGYEGIYQVSDQGHVVRISNGRVLQPGRDQHGYAFVCLYRDGAKKTFRVHLLVKRAFHGLTPDGLEIRHVNGNRQDPRLSNLLWGTHDQNAKDAVAHGTTCRGAKNHKAKLTDDQVREIIAAKGRHVDIGRMFGVAKSTIAYIKEGRTWKHIER